MITVLEKNIQSSIQTQEIAKICY